VAGDYDSVLTPLALEYIASGVQSGRLVLLDGVAHLAPAEAPDRVADLMMQHAGDPA
jgi:pimeloyl-ACP methyl ester carboxylesterase